MKQPGPQGQIARRLAPCPASRVDDVASMAQPARAVEAVVMLLAGAEPEGMTPEPDDVAPRLESWVRAPYRGAVAVSVHIAALGLRPCRPARISRAPERGPALPNGLGSGPHPMPASRRHSQNPSASAACVACVG